MLPARAAAYAKGRDNYTTLFDKKVFEPMVAGPAFVRALGELVEAAKLGPKEQLEFDPAAARAEFWKGTTAMAISWPSAGASGTLHVPPSHGTRSVPATFSELPGATEVFHTSNGKWEPRSGDAGRRVRYLASPGGWRGPRGKPKRQRGIPATALAERSAVEHASLCGKSRHHALPRRSSRRGGTMGRKHASASAAKMYAAQTRTTLSRGQFLASLRLPGRAEYLAALDDAVQAAVRGQQTPSEALNKAAGKWREISKKYGVEKQKAAYMHSLGLE